MPLLEGSHPANLAPGQLAVRWSAKPLPGADWHHIVVGELIEPISDMPGRWRVRLPDGDTERWHRSTILRTFPSNWARAEALMARQVGIATLAHVVVAEAGDDPITKRMGKWIELALEKAIGDA